MLIEKNKENGNDISINIHDGLIVLVDKNSKDPMTFTKNEAGIRVLTKQLKMKLLKKLSLI